MYAALSKVYEVSRMKLDPFTYDFTSRQGQLAFMALLSFFSGLQDVSNILRPQNKGKATASDPKMYVDYNVFKDKTAPLFR